LGIAAGERERKGSWDIAGRGVAGGAAAETMQAVDEIVGVLSGGIEANEEVDGSVALGDGLEALVEAAVAVGRLDEGEFGGGGLEVVVKEGDVVAVARRVDADATAARRLRSGSVV
jgi:hypothetical protein